MTDFDYAATGVPVREDLQQAHRDIWEHVRRPGTWWTGAQRVAIAAAARRATTCSLCGARKAVLSPKSVAGTHDTDGMLPDSVVEVVHRVRTDSGRLSRDWFDTVLGSGLGEPEYVELIGVVTLVTGVDYFARALGSAPAALPQPVSGEPSRYRPVAVKPGGAWVAMIAAENASGPEAEMYGGSPFVPNIMRALSLVPEQVRALQRSVSAHYVPVAQIPDPTVRRALDRMQIELVAARVSALNQCFY